MRVNAERIIRQREEQGWSQTQLAKEAGVASGTMSRVERGMEANPATVKRVADALGLTVADIRAPAARVTVAS